MENKGWRRGKLAAIALCLALAVSLLALSHRFPLSLVPSIQRRTSTTAPSIAFHRSARHWRPQALLPDLRTMHWRVPEVPSDGGASPFLRFRAATVDKVRWNLSSLTLFRISSRVLIVVCFSTGSRAREERGVAATPRTTTTTTTMDGRRCISTLSRGRDAAGTEQSGDTASRTTMNERCCF